MKMLNCSLQFKKHYKMDLEHPKITKAKGDPTYFSVQ